MLFEDTVLLALVHVDISGRPVYYIESRVSQPLSDCVDRLLDASPMPVYSTPSLRSTDLQSSKRFRSYMRMILLGVYRQTGHPTTLLDANALG